MRFVSSIACQVPNLKDHFLVLRCDATSNIGAGHVMRCLALGEAWRSYGGNVILLGHLESTVIANHIRDAGIVYISSSSEFSPEDDLRQLADLFLSIRESERILPWPVWLVLDGYYFDTQYQNAIRRLGYHLCVVDDTSHLDFYDTDVILNQNLGSEALRYSCPDGTQLLLGTRYTLLRSPFLSAQAVEQAVPELAVNVLVTFGGSDTKNQIPKVLRALKRINRPSLTARLVLGFSFIETEEFHLALKGIANLHNVELLSRTEDMPQLMHWADMAISAGGSTTYELAFMGVPMLLTIVAENQHGIVQALHNAGAAISLGECEQLTEEDLSSAIMRVCKDKKLRREMSRLARTIVNGEGNKRVISALCGYKQEQL